MSVRLHSEERKEEIIRLRKVENLHVREIAERLQMNQSTVANICAKGAPRRFVPSRGASAGYFPPKPDAECKDRKCLMCRETFRSSGPGNRRCDPCQEIVDNGTIADEGYDLVGIRIR